MMTDPNFVAAVQAIILSSFRGYLIDAAKAVRYGQMAIAAVKHSLPRIIALMTAAIAHNVGEGIVRVHREGRQAANASFIKGLAILLARRILHIADNAP